MGHTCYVCKKQLKWNNKKWGKSTIEKEQLPPTGMTSEDRLCTDCFHQCPKLNSDIALKRMKIDSLPDGVTSQQCNWCQKEIEVREMQLPPRWIENEQDYCQCTDCGLIIQNLTSTKLEELVNSQAELYNKYIFILEQIKKSEGEWWENAGENPSETATDKMMKAEVRALELKQFELSQQMDAIPSLILKEQLVLAKEYFFKQNPDLKKRTEHHEVSENEDPLKILKIRFAKGEITKEEFDKYH